MLMGGAALWNTLPVSIQKALAISPDAGTTFYDAEHIVLLMQENRSFDHCFGTLRGVRGFGDPRAVKIPGDKPVWFQPDKEGNRFPPFRLNMKDTKATWMGGVPHSWEDQVDARNEGKYDGWIEAKRPGNPDYQHIPLTMGYYTRRDIPFYYALADAFTVCDQHFCAALTGTTTNRSYFWTGKTHGSEGEKPRVRNGELTYHKEADWVTFPERLEEHGVSWKVYQNEISLPTDVEDDSLLANFTDNNLEWFTQYGVWHAEAFQSFLKKQLEVLPVEIEKLKQKDQTEEIAEELRKKQNELAQAKEILVKWTPERFEKLSEKEKNLNRKGFTTNLGDPDYHKIEQLTYQDGTETRSTAVPKGDILHQFREDVKNGELPTVSWLVAPQKFSDHPSAPWYGAWYISEVLDILTQNPEVWKKTIFILNYDENDGYFDHVPPFTAPDTSDPASGKISEGLSTAGEFVRLEEEVAAGFEAGRSRTSPVGLGFRVPLIVASPWSRGGWVNSEVCDITSTIQFMEHFLSRKTGREIKETNISSWRRAISGDLTSVFRPYQGEAMELPVWLDRNQFVKEIYNASFKDIPDNFKMILPDSPLDEGLLPGQEPGTRLSTALNYELYADGHLEGANFVLSMKAGNRQFGEKSLGAPFNVQAPGLFKKASGKGNESYRTWSFAVAAGDELRYAFPLRDFQGDAYHLCLHGPNGFFRELLGSKKFRGAEITCEPLLVQGKCDGKMRIILKNKENKSLKLSLKELNYRENSQQIDLAADESKGIVLDTSSSKGWYDFEVRDAGGNFVRKYAGRLETGSHSISDPLIGA